MFGKEIIDKAHKHHWLAEDVSEEEILTGQRLLTKTGFFVEPSSAASLTVDPTAVLGCNTAIQLALGFSKLSRESRDAKTCMQSPVTIRRFAMNGRRGITISPGNSANGSTLNPIEGLNRLLF
jgi:hypothetical protein